ncbi:hypothetical protein [Streptomyces sp. WAC01280]|uniref:hypothetical protein n=1 Tax=Streptomyces sp. WAC01280 TaxID=2487424 RepID=UPI000F7769A1|nr:hypothetical protein [Streptomyces sp. WAC01280]RSS57452.1 hypothetical protein EF909_16020 [Streptomyces sp. WAC01280]
MHHPGDGDVVDPGMEPTPEPRALAVAQHADAVADAACELADAVAAGTWTPATVEDVIEAIETLAEALLTERAEAARILAATASLRAALAPPGDEPSAAAVPRPRGTRRRGLRNGWKGIR